MFDVPMDHTIFRSLLQVDDIPRILWVSNSEFGR